MVNISALYVASMIALALLVYIPWWHHHIPVDEGRKPKVVYYSLAWMSLSLTLILVMVGLVLITNESFEDNNSGTSGAGANLIIGAFFLAFFSVTGTCGTNSYSTQLCVVIIASLMVFPGLALVTTSSYLQHDLESFVDYVGPLPVVGVNYTSSTVSPSDRRTPYMSYYGYANVALGVNGECPSAPSDCVARAFLPNCRVDRGYKDRHQAVQECVAEAFGLEYTGENGYFDSNSTSNVLSIGSSQWATANFWANCETCQVIREERIVEREDFFDTLDRVGIWIACAGFALIALQCMLALKRESRGTPNMHVPH